MLPTFYDLQLKVVSNWRAYFQGKTLKIRIDTPNSSMDNLATIFSAVRRKLKVDIEVHTVKMAS